MLRVFLRVKPTRDIDENFIQYDHSVVVKTQAVRTPAPPAPPPPPPHRHLHRPTHFFSHAYTTLRMQVGYKFSFESVLHQAATQRQVYEETCAAKVASLLRGESGAMFCYGSSGTGKTYSLLGEASNRGVIPRVLESIFRYGP